MNIDRYSRQTILPEIGEEGQRKIASASVLCVGAGGLGCPALLYLAAAGVGHIGIVDSDCVEESNLQRQVLYRRDQIGENKAHAARVNLLALNNIIKVSAYSERVDAGNIEAISRDFDIIIDGSDNFETKFLVNDAGVKFGKAVVYGSILGFEGQVSVFDAGRGPCYRCLFPAPPVENVLNCAEAGVIGALAGVVGAMQAMEAIKLIVSHDRFIPLIEKIWSIDARTMSMKVLNLPKDPQCPVCSKSKDQIILKTQSEACYVMVKEILSQQVVSFENAILLDVREQEEWDAGHVEGAFFFPLSKLAVGDRPDLSKDQEILVYCRSGMRSMQAAQILSAAGYSNISNIKGGILEMSKYMNVVQN